MSIGEPNAVDKGNGADNPGHGSGERHVGLSRVAHAPSVAVAEKIEFASVIERAARDPNVNIDKFERLLAIKERIDAADALKAFNAAIASARGAIPPLVKNRTVDFTTQKGRTTYKHEDFAEVARTVDPHLSANGLSYRFRTKQDGGKVRVSCVLSHVLGHSEETTLEASEDHSGSKNNIQAIGSSVTYLQRYTLKAALGLAVAADDDGKKSEAETTITDEQAEQIKAALDDTGGQLPRFCAYYKLEKLTDLPAAKFDAAIAAIRNATRRRANG